MSRIIALKGRADSGKSTTIGLMPAILTANSYTVVNGSKKFFGKDFLEVYEKGAYKLGITSAGDTYDLVHQRIDALLRAGCDDVVCACRSHGGTHDAIHGFKGFTSLFIQKTYASSAAAEAAVNLSDAHVVFSKI